MDDLSNDPSADVDTGVDAPDPSADTAAPSEDATAESSAPASPAEDDSDTQASEAPIGPPPPPTAAQLAQDMNTHDAMFQQDLAKGQITPETYQSLFAKKDTLGKIGTIFGMMLSGAGSGLSHQPNALMGMMDQQIKNDFEAQKASNENAVNWHRLSLQHELQKAQIQKMGYENQASQAQTGLAKAQTGKIPSEIAETGARSKNLDADTAIKAQTGAINAMKLAAIQDLSNSVDNLPPGPNKDAGTAAVQNVKSATEANILKDNAQTASQIAGRNPPPPVDNGVDLKKMQKLIEIGQARGSLDMPAGKGMTPADASEATTEAKGVAENRALARAYDDSFKQIKQAKLQDRLNPQFMAAETNTLNAEIARATAGRFVSAEAASQATGVLPSLKDLGSADPEKYRKTMQYFKGQEAGTTTLDRFGLKTPFPYGSGAAKIPADGTTGMSGKTPVIVKNGKWVAQ